MSKESLGVINWWGFTPAIDLFEDGLLDSNNSSDINILLVGCGDSRHILKSLSSIYEHEYNNINFYIIENGIELYARYILQLVISLIPLTKIGLQDKTELFLELYGNTLVRPQTMDFVEQMANELIRLVSDPESCVDVLPFLDLNHLKFKERDILESVFKMWRSSNSRKFDMNLCWDLRIRQNLGVRYDAIPNVFDWDCSITLHDRGADIINSREYCHWRHKGVAFQLRDTNYDASNLTLSSGRVLMTPEKDKTVHLGYWGDIICSPYLAFGIKSSNQSLFHKSNNKFINGASRVSEFNISEIFFQIANNKKYEIPRTSDNKPNTKVFSITEVDENTDEIISQSDDEIDAKNPSKCLTNELLSLSKVKLIFLPVNALSDCLIKKTKFQKIFDIVYFSTSLIGQMESCVSLTELVKPDAKVVIESPKFIVGLNNDQINRFHTRVDEMAKAVGLENCSKSYKEELLKYGHIIYRFPN